MTQGRNNNRRVALEAGPAGGQGQLFEGDGSNSKFRIDFDVAYGATGEPPKGNVKLYGAPAGFASQIRDLGKGAFVRLSAGYGVAQPVFAGSPVKDGVSVVREGAMWVLKMQVHAGGEAYRTAQARVSLSGKVPFRDVIDKAAADAGIRVGYLDLSAAPATFPRGRSYTGPAFALLERLAASAKAQLVYDGEAIHFIRVAEGRPAAGGVRGTRYDAIGQPEHTTEGLDFTIFLDPSVRIGTQMAVRYFDPLVERETTLNVVAREVSHRGGTHDTSFHTKVKARVVGRVGQ